MHYRKEAIYMATTRRVGLTTEDNPYDVFDQFDQWLAYDESHGYHTSGYLARVSDDSFSLSDNDNDERIEAAIDEVIRLHNGEFYKKVIKEQ